MSSDRICCDQKCHAGHGCPLYPSGSFCGICGEPDCEGGCDETVPMQYEPQPEKCGATPFFWAVLLCLGCWGAVAFGFAVLR
jgi:hypothetical protein